jgi:S-DNA-T family DNA segregation ATPase FtsK/SpoIIIE
MSRPLQGFVALLLAAFVVILSIALFSYAPDQVTGASPVGINLIGRPGAWLAHKLIGSWGLAAFYVPVALAAIAILLLRGKPVSHLARRLTGAVALLPALSGILHLLPITQLSSRLLAHWDQIQHYGLGGSMGYFLCRPGTPEDATRGWLVGYVDIGGAALILAVIIAGCGALINLGLITIAKRAWRAFATYKKPAEFEQAGGPRRETPLLLVPKGRTTTSIKELTARITPDQLDAADATDLVERIRARRRALERQGSGELEPELEHAASAPVATTLDAPAPSKVDGPPQAPSKVDGPPQAPSKVEGLPKIDMPLKPIDGSADAPKPKAKKKLAVHIVDEDEYQLPSLDVLDVVPLKHETENELEKQQTARAIEDVFAQFTIPVKVVAAQRGPVITMYEIQLVDQATRAGRVEGYEKDLSLKLGTEGIRIIAPLPNKKTIGIEVPNKHKEQVIMRDLVEQSDVASMTLPLILGRDVIGAPMVGDLTKMPHLLVAGATGTGKSVCMNAIVCSILLFRGPEEVKFIMIDPKMVELAGYEDIPHLLTPPITDMTKAHAALEWACRTMDERYFTLRLVGVRDIKSYNELGEAEIRVRLAKKGKTLEEMPNMQVKMPYIIVLVDEYADLMMLNKEVEKSIIRLAQKSRAAGLHVILTTQRPSADVVTGLIKSNLPARLCFRVADKSNSRVVLDSGGAECLLGRGDMLFLPPSSTSLVRGQGVWVKDKEIEAIIEHAKAQGTPQYDETILSPGSVAMVGGGGSGDERSSEWMADRQFHDAVQSMYRYGRSGADFFRRKLNIGYNKATSYVEQLEDLGFLGPQKGTAPREILKTWDSWIELLKSNGMTWEEDDELYHNPTEVRS